MIFSTTCEWDDRVHWRMHMINHVEYVYMYDMCMVIFTCARKQVGLASKQGKANSPCVIIESQRHTPTTHTRAEQSRNNAHYANYRF